MNYEVSICQGSTGFENRFCFNLPQARSFVEEHKLNYTASIRVWSEKHKDFVYWKDALQYSYDVKEEDKKLLHRNFDLRNK